MLAPECHIPNKYVLGQFHLDGRTPHILPAAKLKVFCQPSQKKIELPKSDLHFETILDGQQRCHFRLTIVHLHSTNVD